MMHILFAFANLHVNFILFLFVWIVSPIVNVAMNASNRVLCENLRTSTKDWSLTSRAPERKLALSEVSITQCKIIRIKIGT
jgi:hypothetical protein